MRASDKIKAILSVFLICIFIFGLVSLLTPKKTCWNYSVIVEVSYIDGTTKEIEIFGIAPGSYSIDPDNQFPEYPKIEIISIRGQGVLVHYPRCGEGPPVIAAWNVGRYKIIRISKGGCYPPPCV